MDNHMCAPENMSLLNPNEFQVYIHRAPYLQFFIQSVSLPSISIQAVKSEGPFSDIVMPGDHINWEQLSITFLVDEDLRGWRECYEWIRGHGFPESFEEYKQALGDGTLNRFDALSSDISVVTNTGSRNANIEFFFRDAIPVMISAPTLSTTNEGQPVVTSKVAFEYILYDVRPIRTS